MTRGEFIQILEEKGYSYEIDGDKLVVTEGDKDGDVNLDTLTTLPPGVVFKNEASVHLYDLTTLPPGVEFKNGGHVDLNSLTTLPPDVVFKNRGDVDLYDLTTLPPGVVFENGGDVWSNSLVGGNFSKWEGNIEGVASKRLLNLMISKALFER